MPKPSKSTKTEVAETAPVVAQTSAPKSKGKKASPEVVSVTSSSSSTSTSAPVVSLAPAPTSSLVSTTVEIVPEVSCDSDIDALGLTAQTTEFLAKLNQLSTLFASLKTEFRCLEKKWGRELKTAQKSQAKRKRKSGNRQPSGFVKPTKISDELAKFLEKPTGTEMARTDVTREINKYIRSHNLQDKDNGRKINPDAKLQSLLKLKKDDELTYFNLQTYMAPHFAKTVKLVPVEKPAGVSV